MEDRLLQQGVGQESLWRSCPTSDSVTCSAGAASYLKSVVAVWTSRLNRIIIQAKVPASKLGETDACHRNWPNCWGDRNSPTFGHPTARCYSTPLVLDRRTPSQHQLQKGYYQIRRLRSRPRRSVH